MFEAKVRSVGTQRVQLSLKIRRDQPVAFVPLRVTAWGGGVGGEWWFVTIALRREAVAAVGGEGGWRVHSRDG